MNDSTKPAAGTPAAPETAPTVFVKGGVTTSKHDNWMAKRQADAEARREQEAQKFQIAKTNPQEARIKQSKLGSRRDHPSVVLGLKHPKDGSVEDWMICEVVDREEGLMLIMQCPRCIRTYHRPPDDCIMDLKQENRMWFLDRRTKAERKFNPILGFCAGEVYVAPDESREAVVVAGMVTTQDWVHCPLCNWTFKIDDSVVHTRG